MLTNKMLALLQNVEIRKPELKFLINPLGK